MINLGDVIGVYRTLVGVLVRLMMELFRAIGFYRMLLDFKLLG